MPLIIYQYINKRIKNIQFLPRKLKLTLKSITQNIFRENFKLVSDLNGIFKVLRFIPFHALFWYWSTEHVLVRKIHKNELNS